MDSGFHTLGSYTAADGHAITLTMEDYLEMIYRQHSDNGLARVGDLARRLQVQPSAASKMVQKLRERGLVNFQKYGVITLTPAGEMLGAELLDRHRLLTAFFGRFTPPALLLPQVEMAEHFLLPETLEGIRRFVDAHE